MYEIDDKDQVIEITNVPQSSGGAPNPMVLAGEDDVFLAYYLHTTKNWDGKSPMSISIETEGKPVAVVKLENITAHFFGPPNDEASSGHPLASRGLLPYRVFEITNSSWIRKLEKMNAVHPYHNRRGFMEKKKHFIFAFHDTTFECVAEGFTLEVSVGSVKSMIARTLEAIS